MATNKYGDSPIQAETKEAPTSRYGGRAIDPIYAPEPDKATVEQAPNGDPSIYQQVDQRNGTLNRGLHGTMEGAAGEFAARSNETVIGGADALVNFANKGLAGYNAAAELAIGGDVSAAANVTPIPTMTELIDMGLSQIAVEARPGQGNFMEDGLMRTMVGVAGALSTAGLGMKEVVARNLNTSAGQAAELLGFGSAKTPPLAPDDFKFLEPGQSKAVATVDDVVDSAPAASQVADDLPPIPSGQNMPPKLRRELAIKRAQGDISGVGYKLDDLGNVVRDKADIPVQKAGWADGTIAAIKTANKATRAGVRKMVDMVDRGIRNDNFKGKNPPGNVVGESMNHRIKIVRDAFMKSKGDIDVASQNLEGIPININDAMETLLGDLKKFRIGVTRDANGHLVVDDAGKVALDFTESDIRGITTAENFVQRLMDYIHYAPGNTALDVHHAKRFIDHNVSYSKQVEGLPGAMEVMAKRLRHNLDSALDSLSPEYDAANTMYSDTVQLLDDIQRLTGSRVDLMSDSAEVALGTMSRKVLSNYQSGTQITDTLDGLEEIARKYAGDVGVDPSILDDSISELINAEAAIRNTIPGVAKASSLQGIVDTAAGRTDAAELAVDALAGSPAALARAGIKVARRAKKDPKSPDVTLKQLEALRVWLDQL